MCSKNLLYDKREGFRLILSLPLKHKNHIKNLLLTNYKRVKIATEKEVGKGEIKLYEKHWDDNIRR